jgi:hypothetical protein
MNLIQQLADYVNAAFSGLWVHTCEPEEAEREILQAARQRGWTIAAWDIARGLRLPGSDKPTADTAGEPLAPVKALAALAQKEGSALLLLHNYHRFFQNPEVVQQTFNVLVAGKQQRTFVVILSPVVQIPPELEKLIVVIEHSLPERDHLQRIAQELVSDHPEDMPEGQNLQRILDAAAGLTRYEAEGAFALSLTRHNALRPDCVWEIKTQTLRKNGLLTLHRGDERFDTLGGLVAVKDFCLRALAPQKRVRPRGILLLGVPGSGKSAFAKALGNETGRPTLVLDVGNLLGSLVGQSEQNIRQALRIADAMSPCVLFLDEVEKALSGVGSQGDNGVSTRLFGSFLTWLSDHTSDVFVIATANDISKLPPEFSRAERFDGVFFLDLPTTAEKDSIWQLYRRLFEVPPGQARPDDTDWTGAEIRACCRLASLLDVPLTQAARNVVPVAVTAMESMQKLRTWATGRCLSASQPGIFGKEEGAGIKAPRRVQRPGNN